MATMTKLPKAQAEAQAKALVDWNDPNYQYTGNSRQRILRTPDSEHIIKALQDFYCTPKQSPVLKMALRYLETHGPDPEQLAYVRANPAAHRDCRESSWSGKQAEMSVVRRFAGELEIQHREVIRLALRMLAASVGLLES